VRFAYYQATVSIETHCSHYESVQTADMSGRGEGKGRGKKREGKGGEEEGEGDGKGKGREPPLLADHFNH